MGLSIWQLAVVAILVILLFGRGKLSGLMSDLAEGIKSFRQGIKDNPDDAAQAEQLTDQTDRTASKTTTAATTAVD